MSKERIRIIKAYVSEAYSLEPGQEILADEALRDELILGGFAEYPEEEIDIEIERTTAENPKAIANLNAYVDAEIAAGRCKPIETLCAEERKRRRSGGGRKVLTDFKELRHVNTR